MRKMLVRFTDFTFSCALLLLPGGSRPFAHLKITSGNELVGGQ
jgi:hypothetical protein